MYPPKVSPTFPTTVLPFVHDVCAGIFSLTGPTPSLSLLGDDEEYLIRTSVRKRHRPKQEAGSTAEAGAGALFDISLKEKLMAHQPKKDTPRHNNGRRKRPHAGEHEGKGREEACFTKPVAKKVRADAASPGRCASKARSAKRKSVTAEDLLEMCQ